jgi:Leu/Phe-tRNA-protein transferase
MQARGMTLLDVQWTTPHLLKFGVEEISRAHYLRRLKTAIRLEVSFV